MSKSYHTTRTDSKPWVAALKRRDKRALQWHFARHYATAFGWRVFPLTRLKEPATENGCHDGTTDLRQIDEWWKRRGTIKGRDGRLRYGTAPIGLSTGKESGVWVIDVDAHHDGEESLIKLLDQLGIELPQTLTAKTPSGGRHYYFRWPKLPEGVDLTIDAGTKLGKGIDIRGNGGYVVLPHSESTKGWYEWLEYKDGRSVSAPIAFAPWELVKLATGQEIKSGKAYVEAAVRNECETVASTPEGNRNTQLFWSARALGQLIGGGELDRGEVEDALFEAATTCGLVKDDGDRNIRKTITNGIEAGLKKPRTAPKRELAISKARSRNVTQNRESEENTTRTEIKLIRGDMIKPRPMQWLWPNRIVAHELNTIFGEPKRGKSLITCDIAARLTTGAPWPDEPQDTPRREPMSVLMIAREDNLETVVIPRLLVAGADVSRMYFLDSVARYDEKGRAINGMLALDQDLQAMEAMLKQYPDIGCIEIDPLSSYIGRAGMWKDQEIRQVLTPFVDLLRRTEVTGLYLLHTNKKQDVDIMQKASGAGALVSLPRSNLLAAIDKRAEEDSGERSFVFGDANGSNYSGEVPALRYKIEGALTRRKHGSLPTQRIVWQGASLLSIHEATGFAKPSKLTLAMQWLKEALADGPRLVEEIKHEAKADGHKEKTLLEAKRKLGIKHKKDGFGLDGKGWWQLPKVRK